MSLLRQLRRLARSRSGVAMTEFALGSPLLLMAGLWGTEEANYALVNMKIGQLAVHIADNASRIGDTSQLKNRKIYEDDINDVIFGAHLQAGKQLDVYKNGRVIISSLEVDDASGKQYIHWQRCRGAKHVSSSYGNQGDGLSSNMDGMGPPGEEVYAQPGEAVIFVEINYTYQPLISASFMGDLDIKSVSSFVVRDSRDLTQIYQRDPVDPDPIQTCTAYTGAPTVSAGGKVV